MAARPGREQVRRLRPGEGEFSLTEEQAFCPADPNGPNLPEASLAVLAHLRAEPRITEAFRTGADAGFTDFDGLRRRRSTWSTRSDRKPDPRATW